MDLVDIDDISETSILNELKGRFNGDQIYSNIGPIIIALNPYKQIHSLYSQNNMKIYMNLQDGKQSLYGSVLPHIWKIAQESFASIKQTSVPQAIVISGESGAGKTEATKKCLEFLSAIASSSATNSGDEVANKVLVTNPLLESFGNAKTARNNNSSRFGKWLEVQFVKSVDTNEVKLIGANITQYLLEKSRVVSQSTEERNYHIFYQMCASNQFPLLKKAVDYRYLNPFNGSNAAALMIDGVDDAADFQLTARSMDKLGFTEEDKTTIFEALQAILLLGNVDIQSNPDLLGNKSQENVPQAVVAQASQKLLWQVSELLGLNIDLLQASLVSKTLTLRGEKTTLYFDAIAATDAKHALAKEIYARLFGEIVRHANMSLCPPSTKLNNNELATSIGLLDIFGFEKFKFNSFEQLCINYANEKLQQYFINFVLKKEQELYLSEGIAYEMISLADNEDVLSLLENKKNGIFSKLDDELKLPKTSDESFVKKIETEHHSKAPERRFIKDIKMSKLQFEIRHFAGVIRYEGKGFLEKNRDKMHDHLEDLLISSTKPLFREIMRLHGPLGGERILTEQDANTSTKSNEPKSATIATKFQAQLSRLMNILNMSDPHFIKCIKPNNVKLANQFETDVVTVQLRYSGVLEAIQVRKHGYPTRRTHQHFRQLFWMLIPNGRRILTLSSEYEKCQAIIASLQSKNPVFNQIQLGKTLVFLKPDVLTALEAEKKAIGLKAIVFMQKTARMFLCRKWIRTLYAARRDLRKAVQEARRKNSSNIDAIPQLTAAMKHCKHLKMANFELTQANTLLVRLHEVKECLDQLTNFLPSTQNKVSKPNITFVDVVEEYEYMSKLYTNAHTLHIQSDSLVEVGRRVEKLQERAVCLRKLRDAVAEGEEHALEAAIGDIEAMNRKYEGFGSKDETAAKNALSQLKKDNLILGKALQLIDTFESEYHDMFMVAPVKNADVVCSEWLQSHVPLLDRTVNEVLAGYGAGSVGVGGSGGAGAGASGGGATARGKEIMTYIINILTILAMWKDKNWSTVATFMERLRNSDVAMMKSILAKTPIGNISSGGAAAAKANKLIDSVHRIVQNLTVIVQSGVLNYHILPRLNNWMEQGSVRGTPGAIDYESVTIEPLHKAIAELDQYCSWCATELIIEVQDRLTYLSELRTDLLDHRNYAILHKTCKNMAEEGMLRRRMQLFQVQLNSYSTESNEFPIISEENTRYDQITNIVEAVAKIPNVEIASWTELLQKEVALIRLQAWDSCIINMVEMVLPCGRVVGEVGSIDDAAVTSAPLTLLLTEVDHITTICNDTSRFPSKACDTVLHYVRMLDLLREAWKCQRWSVTLEHFEGKTHKLIHATEEYMIRGPSAVRDVLTLLRSEVITITMEAVNFQGIADCLAAVATGAAKGLVGERDYKSIEYAYLHAIHRKYTDFIDFFTAYGEFSEELGIVLSVTKSLGDVRKQFIDHAPLYERRTAVDELCNYGMSYAIPETLEAEMKAFQHEIAYCECIELLKVALRVDSSIGVNYFTTAPTKVNKPIRASTLQPNRPRVGSADSSTAFPSSPMSPFSPVSIPKEDILASEGQMLNDDTLCVDLLNEALSKAEDFQASIESDELPAEFFNYAAVLQYVCELRLFVKDYHWENAIATIKQLQEGQYLAKVPTITEEILQNTDTIHNYAIISTTLGALLQGAPIGPVGQVDYKPLNTDHLETSVAFCQSIGCKTARAEALYKALLAILDLRQAQKALDWGRIKSILNRIDSEGIGKGHSEICFYEIKRAVVEKDNYEAIQLLKKSIVNEEITAIHCVIQSDSVVTKELGDALARAKSIAISEDSSTILKALYTTGSTIYNLRNTIRSKSWNHVPAIVNLFKDNLEALLKEIEKIEKAGLLKKTGSARRESQRGTILIKDRAKSDDITGKSVSFATNSPQGSVVAPTPLSPVFSLSKSAVWEEYNDVLNSMRNEISLIDHHFAAIELENSLNKALKENGIYTETVGEIDKTTIKTDTLLSVMASVTAMESTHNVTLPEAVRQKNKVAHVICDIRNAVLADKWDTVKALLEETLDSGLGTIPDASRLEIQTVRRELENKQIIATLEKSLNTGKLEGTPGSANLSNVSCDHLITAIHSCNALTPRTELAKLLLKTAEAMYELRKLLATQINIQWKQVVTITKDLLTKVQRQLLHNSILTELQLTLETAEDTIICEALRKALSRGGVGGVPGRIDLRTIAIDQLESACQLAYRSKLSQEASFLFQTCRTIQLLRETLLKTSIKNADVAAEAWVSVHSILKEIMKAKESAFDMSWEICRDEVSIVVKHSHIQELQSKFVENLIKTSQIYAARNDINITQLNLTTMTTAAESGASSSTGGGSSGSVIPHNVYESLGLELPIAPLEEVIKFGQSMEFDSDMLVSINNCMNTLKHLRITINDHSWEHLASVLKDKNIKESLSVVPEALQELSWIHCEISNHVAIEQLILALSPVTKTSTASGGASSASKSAADSHLSTSIQESSFEEQNKILDKAIHLAQRNKLSSKAGKQLLECCQHISQLRTSLVSGDNASVAHCLRWFQANVHICPQHVRKEADRAYIVHQNDLLIKGLTLALREGRASGVRGSLDVSTIRIEALGNLLKQAESIQIVMEEAKDLLEAGHLIHSIRSALLKHDMLQLREIIDHVTDYDNIHLLVIDEVAMARAEMDDEITCSSLIDALKSFDDTESKALDLSLWSNNQSKVINQNIEEENKKDPNNKSSGASILQSFSSRRYSFANKNNANIDLDTIDVDILDRGMRIANDHGVFSVRARRLLRTVILIRALRIAMKASEWHRVQEILTESQFDKGLLSNVYDSVASKEISAIKSQLEMRAAVVDLSVALRNGWAKCSNGIVDISSLSNDSLAHAIHRAEKSVIDLCQGTLLFVNKNIISEEGQEETVTTFDFESFLATDKTESQIQRQVILLLKSAKIVLSIREVLALGNLELAGRLSEDALNNQLHYSVVDELKLYAKEINAALETMKVFQALRVGMTQGNINLLRGLIQDAMLHHLSYSNDLGLIRTIEQAHHTVALLLKTKDELIAIQNIYYAAAIQKIINKAVKLHLEVRELEVAQQRLVALHEYEAAVKELLSVNYGLLSTADLQREIVAYGERYNMVHHPMTIKATRLLNMSEPSQIAAIMHEAIVFNNVYVIATKTIQMKRPYLLLASTRMKYKLENYPMLRTTEDYGMRMNLLSLELKNGMLSHSDQALPTSLTRQSPVLAALSVWIFSHCIRGIERNIYGMPATMLKKLILLGRQYIPIRDEVYLQILKQLNKNTDTDYCKRLWRMLTACLYHFPPSVGFESYLELFLYENLSSGEYSSQVKCCIRYLHHCVFAYGYDRKIVSQKDTSLKAFEPWLTEESYCPDFPTGRMPDNDAAFESVDNAAFTTPVVASPLPPAAAVSGFHPRHASPSSSAHSVSAVSPSPIAAPSVRLRGTREDWIRRFTLFNSNHKDSKDGRHMNKQTFAATISSSILPESTIDRQDLELLYFLLFGKNLINRSGIYREYVTDDTLFHYKSTDEAHASQARRNWLQDHVTVTDKSSELFFSQLKTSDLMLYAERFWERVVEKMSVECLHFPFLHIDELQAQGKTASHGSSTGQGNNTTVTSPAGTTAGTTASLFGGVKLRKLRNSVLTLERPVLDDHIDDNAPPPPPPPLPAVEKKEPEILISWELYREILLVGMHVYLAQSEVKLKPEEEATKTVHTVNSGNGSSAAAGATGGAAGAPRKNTVSFSS